MPTVQRFINSNNNYFSARNHLSRGSISGCLVKLYAEPDLYKICRNNISVDSEIVSTMSIGMDG